MAVAGGSPAPRKPWEGAQSAVTGASPFRPASSETSSTAAVVESSGVANSGNTSAITNATRYGSQAPIPTQSYGSVGYNQYNNSYAMNPSYGGAYNNYNSGYGMNSGMYGGVSGSYGGGMYGSNYGGSMYGSSYGMGMGRGMGMSMGGMGMGMGMGGMGGMGMGMGGPGSFQNGPEDPNNPFGAGGPPSFWQSLLHRMHWMVVVFSNVAGLIAENTQTFNLITTALFQFFERSGMLAGFVLKLLRMWSRPKTLRNAPSMALPGPKKPANLRIEGPKSTAVSWDNVWSNELAG